MDLYRIIIIILQKANRNQIHFEIYSCHFTFGADPYFGNIACHFVISKCNMRNKFIIPNYKIVLYFFVREDRFKFRFWRFPCDKVFCQSRKNKSPFFLFCKFSVFINRLIFCDSRRNLFWMMCGMLLLNGRISCRITIC